MESPQTARTGQHESLSQDEAQDVIGHVMSGDASALDQHHPSPTSADTQVDLGDGHRASFG